MTDTSTYPLRSATFAELQELVGIEIGPTRWYEVTQDRINAFAELTGDRQWIHIDPERAATSPLGSTIAHGLYGLSLGAAFSCTLLSFEGFAHSLNYGYDKVRFPVPVPVGSRIRMRSTILSADRASGGIQVRCCQTFEREGADKPVIVAEPLARVVEDADAPAFT